MHLGRLCLPFPAVFVSLPLGRFPSSQVSGCLRLRHKTFATWDAGWPRFEIISFVQDHLIWFCPPVMAWHTFFWTMRLDCALKSWKRLGICKEPMTFERVWPWNKTCFAWKRLDSKISNCEANTLLSRFSLLWSCEDTSGTTEDLSGKMMECTLVDTFLRIPRPPLYSWVELV